MSTPDDRPYCGLVRIALVTDYYLPTLGGVQTVVKAHREALEQAGHDVTVYAPLAAAHAPAGVVRLPTASRFAPDGYPFAWPPRALLQTLRTELTTRGTEVVHVHTEMFAALAAFRAAAECALPLVQTMHGRVDVYTRAVLPVPALTTPILAALHRKQIPHDTPVQDTTAPYAQGRIARRIWRLMLAQANRADHVIVPSAHFTAKLTAQGMTTPVSVLSNGLEQSMLDVIGTPQVRTLTADETLRVMWCGRVSPEKRPEVFVDAVRASAHIRADLYGDGVARRRIRRRARGLGNLTIHGAVSQHAVLEGMRNAHVFVSTSWDFDNQPMVLLEAIASGLPTIVTDPDLAELLPEGGHIVTDTPDAAGVATALRRLRDAPEELARMSRATIAHREEVTQSGRLEGLLGAYHAAIARAQASMASRES